jgi:GMP synthase-like glutamine amidotransferase
MDREAADDPVLGTLGARPHVFQFHYDAFGEPETGAILGRTGRLNQVARIGDRAWAVQFHLEVSPGAIYSWIGTYGDEMRERGVDLDALAVETAECWREYRRLARVFGDAFAREVAAFAARRS